MMKMRYAGLIMGLFFLYACGSSLIGSKIPFVRILDSNHFGAAGPGSYSEHTPAVFITSSDTEYALLSEFIPSDLEKSIPSINYDTDILISVFRGVKSGSGFDTSISEISISGENIYIYTRFDSPRPGYLQQGGIRSPFSIVSVSRTHLMGAQNLSVHLLDAETHQELAQY